MRLRPARRRREPTYLVLRHVRCKHVERIFLPDMDGAEGALRRAGNGFELAWVPLPEAGAQLLADRCGEGRCGDG